MGQNIYFNYEQLCYLQKLIDSFDGYDAIVDGDNREAEVLEQVMWKVFNAMKKENCKDKKD